MAQKNTNKNGGISGAQLGFEADMFKAADKLKLDARQFWLQNRTQ